MSESCKHIWVLFNGREICDKCDTERVSGYLKYEPDLRVVTLYAMEHGLSEDAARRALMSETGTSVVIATPDPGDSLYEECLATQGEPEIPVTYEMRTAAQHVARIGKGSWTFDMIYRAMAAVAPVELYGPNERRIDALQAENAALSGRIEELQSYSHALAVGVDERNARDQETEAYQYLKRLFLHLAPQCCVLPDLLGVCTQVDNAIVGLKEDKAALLATVEMLDKRLGVAAFSAASDLPDPPRRPDGTLAPQGKPWAPPPPVGDTRRIGG